MSVEAQAVETRVIPEVVTATGELYAEDRASLSTKVSGRVARIHVDLGSRVSAGDVVAEIEKQDYELAVEQAQAMVEQTRARLGLGASPSDDVKPEETALVRQAAAQLEEARFIHETATKLFQDGVVSNVDHHKARIAKEAAEARHQAAIEEVFRIRAELIERRAHLALARQQLSDTVIRAPFSGAITMRRATLGEFLPVNAPVAELVRSHPMRIRLTIPERVAPKVRAGQRIEIKIEGMASAPVGTVVRLSPAIESLNRSLLVEGEVPNQSGVLRAGSFVEAAITVNPQARGLAVPRRAVVSFAGIDRVFLVEGGTLAERIVKLGRPLDNGDIEIVDGLNPGVVLVTNPSDRLANGRRVVVEPRGTPPRVS